LLTAFKGYLANEWDRQNALKRGGGQRLISLDQSAAEARYDLEPSHADTPDLVFEKRWALELISNARERLRAEMEDSGKSDRFALLEQKLPGGANDLSYEDIAERIDSTPAAVKQSVHRLKSRYRDLIREEVAKTVASPEEVDEEIAYLMDILGKS